MLHGDPHHLSARFDRVTRGNSEDYCEPGVADKLQRGMKDC
jgi:hypothetical protein